MHRADTTSRRPPLRAAGLIGLALAASAPAGCTRAYWRTDADAEVYGLIREKTTLDARWTPPRVDVIPSPLSRNYDLAHPDYGPLPPDDPAAHLSMERMGDCNRIRGPHYYDLVGQLPSVDNPSWVASLGGPEGPPPGVCPPNPPADPVIEPQGWMHRLIARAPWNKAAEADAQRMLAGGQAPAAGRATISTIDVAAADDVKPAAAPPRTAPAAENPFASDPEPAAATKDRIRLASFQDDPAPPPATPATDPAAPPLPVPPAVAPLPEVPPGEARPVMPILPDPDEELSVDPGDPATAPTASVGPDLAAGNPALPPIDDLTLAEAVRLSYLHNRDYQFQIENVYLQGLQLALDRFQFDVRFLGLTGQRPTDTLTYNSVPGGTQSLTNTSRFGVSRLLPAGGQWTVDFLNNTLWLFGNGPSSSGTASTLSYSFVQPLLFGAGRRYILEGLIQSERNLLYAIRDLARFRQTFFVDTVSGGPGGGYLGLLTQIQQIANQEDNIRRIEEQLEIATQVATDALTVTQLEGQLLSAENSLRSSRRLLQDSLDQYKVQLGLPPDLRMTLDTTLLEPFQLVSPDLLAIERDLRGEFYAAAFSRLSPTDPDPEGLRRTVAVLRRLTNRLREVGVEAVEADYARAVANLPTRFANLTEPRAENEARIRRNLDRDREAIRRAEADFAKLEEELAGLVRDLDAAATAEARQEVYRRTATIYQTRIEYIVRGLQGIQIGLRTELIQLNPFVMSLDEAVGYGLTNRVDLMNQRGFVTDSRRKVEVAANQLKAVLNVNVQGDTLTRPLSINDNPLDFRGAQSSYRVGVSFTAPLNQVIFRNAYRQSQITYQRARRAYTLFEDRDVKFAIRQDWRRLEVAKQNFEVARNAIRVAAIQYDQTVERATAPAGAAGGGSSGGGGTTGLNLLNALSRILQNQNQLIQTWVDYETARLNIYSDMGVMEIDTRGLWVDPFYQDGIDFPVEPRAGLPGRPEVASATDPAGGRIEGIDVPELEPPAPGPPAGVDTPDAGPTGPGLRSAPDAPNPFAPASPGPASPAGAATDTVGAGVLPVAHSVPTASPPREAGHVRIPPVRPAPRGGDRTEPDGRQRPGDDAAGPPRPPAPARSGGGSPARLPAPRRRKRWLLLVPVLLAAGFGVAWAAGWVSGPKSFSGRPAANARYLTDVASKGPFRITVRERGTIDSLKSVTLNSQLEGTSTIISIVPEGTKVKAGDLLVELDASALVEKEKQQVIAVTQAEAALKKAEESVEIQKRQNESDLSAAELAKTLAILDLDKFKRGDFIQQQNEMQGLIQVAEEDLARAQEVLTYTSRLAQKGYKSQNDLKADQIAVTKAEINLAAAKDKLRVLTDFTYRRTIEELEEKSEEAVRQIDRVKRQGEAALTQFEADVQAALLTKAVESDKLERARVQIAACRITAPQDGEVVYATGDDRRSDSQPIAEGTTVRERQAIIKLPNLAEMKVDARIHESLIGLVREGLPALIRVDAMPGKVFTGRVTSVSSVPVAGSWFRPDLKEYSCAVSIDRPAGEEFTLKPGLTAEVEILVQERTDVLQVPFQAVVTAGDHRFVYVLGPAGAQRREVLTGASNDTHIEILDGVTAGERVVMNPRTHFADELAAFDAEAKAKQAAEEPKPGEPAKAAAPAAGPQPGGPASAGPAAGGPQAGPGGPQAGGPGAGGPPGGGRRDPAAFFARMDADGDGVLTEAELPAGMKDRFATLDANADGKVDKAEFTAGAKGMGGGPGGGGPGGPGGPPQ